MTAAKRHVVVIDGYDPGDPDVTVSADVIELWDRYGTELREDGMCGKSPEEIIRHVYGQNPDAPELFIEDGWVNDGFGI